MKRFTISGGFAVVAVAMLGGAAFAQSIEILHTFDNFTQGRSPASHGVLSPDGSVLYGTTSFRLGGFGGSVWKINTDGTGFEVLREIGGSASPADGDELVGELILHQPPSGPAKLVGLCRAERRNVDVDNANSLWQMNLDGSNFQVLHAFDPSTEGVDLQDLRAYGDGFIGVARSDFLNDAGTVWRINSDGSGFQTLKLFTAVSEGRYPVFAPTPVGSTLYGTTRFGSLFDPNPDGTIYCVDDDGSNFRTIHTFQDIAGELRQPTGRLIESGGYLYGVTSRGGAHDDGAIFRFTPDGDADDLEIVFDFDRTQGAYVPQGGVSLGPNGTTIWGTTFQGGIDDQGVLWSYDTVTDEGAFVANLGPIGYGSSAVGPGPRFSPDGMTLYGTTPVGGGLGNNGTIWRYSLTDGCAADLDLDGDVDFDDFATLGSAFGSVSTVVSYNPNADFDSDDDIDTADFDVLSNAFGRTDCGS